MSCPVFGGQVIRVSKLGIASNAIPLGMTVEFKAIDPDTQATCTNIVIFPKREVGVSGAPTLIFSNSAVATYFGGSGTTVLGIEGRAYGKQVIIRMTLKNNGAIVGSDHIRVLVAPFIVQSADHQASKVYIGADASNWSDFYDDTVAALSGFSSVETYGAPSFIQDIAEIGYSRSPTNQTSGTNMSVIMGLYGSSFSDLITNNVGYCDDGSGRAGGDIEASMPDATHPFGRIIVGSNLSSSTKDFFKEQLVQTDNGQLIEVNVSWLSVGHIDEVMTMVPTSNGYTVLVADLQTAIDSLRTNTSYDASGTYGTNSITRQWLVDVYSDTNNQQRISEITNALASIRTVLAQGLGISESRFIKVPVAFTMDSPSKTYLPNMVNMLIVSDSNHNKRVIIPLSNFAPFQSSMAGNLLSVGCQSADLYFVDTTGPHSAGGEAHCATSPFRKP